MKKTCKILSLVLALVVALSLAACTKKQGEEPLNDTLVVGYSYFNAKFSPFFATTAYDQDVVTMTQLALLNLDRGGAVVLDGINGETRAYNGTDYLYDGIASCEVVQNDDGTVDYNVTMREDIKFSDGEPMTIDDAIFSLYVFCDPTYDGASTIYAQPIVGMAEYRSGMDTLLNLLVAAGEDNTDYSMWTEAEQKALWDAVNDGGVKFAQEIVDYCVNAGYAADSNDVATAAAAWGFGDLAADATAKDFFLAIADNYGWKFADMEAETAGSALADLIPADVQAYATRGISTGEGAANIAGIVRTGDYSMTIKMSEFDATSILNIGIVVAPLHYYGDEALYNYDNNSFGFTKGDLSNARAKTTAPMGAGPYKFVSYENGVITFEANENYWKGVAPTKYILFQETSDADKLTGVATGTFDLSDPSISTAAIESIKGYNSNGELTGDVITTDLVDNNGYGYIGMCAGRVNVGGEYGSEASKNLRKGFATLFAVYRDAAINSYYGDRAVVIQYPITNTSWAAPQPADEGYAIAYSTDVDGNPIYTEGMSEEEKYAAAKQAAIGFFKAAGYTFDEASGMFTAAPAGAAMSYELQIPGDGVGDHPAFAVVTNTATALAELGFDLQINDLSNSSGLFTGIEAGTIDMWAAAWGNSFDPDMYQVYHSSNVAVVFGGTGTTSNSYCVRDEELDQLIVAGRSSADTAYRKSIYKQCLDILLDWACEVPTYQRKNGVIFSTERVDMESVTPDITTFWPWLSGVDTIKVK